MVKKGIKQFLAGMCAVLVMPTGTVQNVLAKESEQALPVSAEKSINQELKLWYTSPAKIDTAETNGGEWMQQSLPLGNGNLGILCPKTKPARRRADRRGNGSPRSVRSLNTFVDLSSKSFRYSSISVSVYAVALFPN